MTNIRKFGIAAASASIIALGSVATISPASAFGGGHGGGGGGFGGGHAAAIGGGRAIGGGGGRVFSGRSVGFDRGYGGGGYGRGFGYGGYYGGYGWCTPIRAAAGLCYLPY